MLQICASQRKVAYIYDTDVHALLVIPLQDFVQLTAFGDHVLVESRPPQRQWVHRLGKNRDSRTHQKR